MSDPLTPESFQPLLNATMRAPVEGVPGGIELELTEIDVLASEPPAPGMRIPFNLIFSGPKDQVLPEGTYELTGPDEQSLVLYLIPILSVGERQQYQSVFN